MIFLALLLLFPHLSLSSDYICKTNRECLDYLHDTLLNENSDGGIYRVCKGDYQRARSCCINPFQCGGSYSEDLIQNLMSRSLNTIQQGGNDLSSCQLNPNLKPFLSSAQGSICNMEVKNCKVSCESKLKEVEQTFKECFSLKPSHSIEAVLRKAQTQQNDQNCWRTIKDVAARYKQQSLEGRALLKENLKSSDVVNCGNIKKEISQKNLKDFALNVCQRLQKQKKREEEQKKRAQEQKRRVQEQKKKAQEQKRRAQEQKRRAQEQKKKAQEQKKKAQKRKKRAQTAQTSNLLGSQNKSTGSMTSAKLQKRAVTDAQSLHGLDSKAKELVQSANLSENCSVPFPEIKSAVVFQSVESPQIEPMAEQNNPPYDNYDLARGKPAGVLVRLDKSVEDRFEEDFEMSLNIDNSLTLSSCFHKPFQGNMQDGGQKLCFVKESNFSRQLSYPTTTSYPMTNRKFFPLPMTLLNKARENVSVKVNLYLKDKPNCKKVKSFNMNIVETKRLELSFTWVNDTHCRNQGGSSNYKWSHNPNALYSPNNQNDPINIVKGFIESDEVSHYLEAMFPVAKVNSSFLKNKRGKEISINGVCKNRKPSGSVISIGLFRDLRKLERKKRRMKVDKVTAIVPTNYFHFHFRGLPQFSESIGLFIHRVRRNFLLWNIYYPGWNTLFIREDQKNNGVVAHELAHSLNQLREFYDSHDSQNQPNICSQFNNPFNKKPCPQYQIPRALYRNKKDKFWRFNSSRFSIMNNKMGIDNLWIDRDTYQKNLKFLKEISSISKTSRTSSSENQNRSLKAIVSGFYYKGQEEVVIVPEVTRARTSLVASSDLTTENKGITVQLLQLKDGDKKETLQSVKHPILEMKMKVFYKDRKPETFPFPASPFLVVLNLPESKEKQKLRIEILGPNGNMLHFESVPAEEKDEDSV